MVEDCDIDMDCESTEELIEDILVLEMNEIDNSTSVEEEEVECKSKKSKKIKRSATITLDSSPCGSKRIFPNKTNPVPKRFRNNSFIRSAVNTVGENINTNSPLRRSASVMNIPTPQIPLPPVPFALQENQNQNINTFKTANIPNFNGDQNNFAFSAVKRTKSESMSSKRKIDLRHSTNSINICRFPSEKRESAEMISTQTCAELINGKYKNIFDDHIIIDCRYPYEFEGGHIAGAINIPPCDRDSKLKEMFFTNPSQRHNIAIVFHCEFSSVRGPDTYKQLRAIDRSLNTYPSLFYPHVYVMKGGYRKFHIEYEGTPNCNGSYTEMKDKQFKEQLKLHKSLGSSRKRSISFINSKNIRPLSRSSETFSGRTSYCKNCTNLFCSCNE